MTLYEILIAHKEFCEETAKRYLQKNDYDMSRFYLNAALGYKAKAEALIVERLSA
ncbi:MAG: hypothetical protein MJ160_04805 [Treponema sp.]|nr:hypothetical protein [Treponema sp.]